MEALYFFTTEGLNLKEIGMGSTLSPATRHDWGWGSELAGLSAHLPLGSSARLEARMGSSTFNTELATWWLVLGQRSDDAAAAVASMADRMVSTNLVATGSWAGMRHELSLGGELRRSRMHYDSWRGDNPPDGLWSEFVPTFRDGFLLDAAQFWVEDQITFASDRFGVRMGLRGTSPKGLDTALQPRVGLRIALTDWLALTAC